MVGAQRTEGSRKNEPNGLSLQYLFRYADEDMLNRIVTGDELWVHHYQPESKCASKQRRHPSSSSTKRFKVMPSARKVMLTVFWDSYRVLLTHFPNHGENVTSALYSEVLFKLWNGICIKRPGQLPRGVLLHHDNATPHIAQATQEKIHEIQWELLEQLPYSPDLAPSDLNGALKNHLGGKRFAADEVVQKKVRKWLREQSKDFYAVGFDALAK
jgi:histone-lysine N-methyltransferase SETMAR